MRTSSHWEHYNVIVKHNNIDQKEPQLHNEDLIKWDTKEKNFCCYNRHRRVIENEKKTFGIKIDSQLFNSFLRGRIEKNDAAIASSLLDPMITSLFQIIPWYGQSIPLTFQRFRFVNRICFQINVISIWCVFCVTLDNYQIEITLISAFVYYLFSVSSNFIYTFFYNILPILSVCISVYRSKVCIVLSIHSSPSSTLVRTDFGIT